MRGFKDYQLKVRGLLNNPVELSVADARALGKMTQITRSASAVVFCSCEKCGELTNV